MHTEDDPKMREMAGEALLKTMDAKQAIPTIMIGITTTGPRTVVMGVMPEVKPEIIRSLLQFALDNYPA